VLDGVSDTERHSIQITKNMLNESFFVHIANYHLQFNAMV